MWKNRIAAKRDGIAELQVASKLRSLYTQSRTPADSPSLLALPSLHETPLRAPPAPVLKFHGTRGVLGCIPKLRGSMAEPGSPQGKARRLLSGTKLSALLRPQHVVTIKDSASVDQTLRVRRRAVEEAWRAGCAFVRRGPSALLAVGPQQQLLQGVAVGDQKISLVPGLRCPASDFSLGVALVCACGCSVHGAFWGPPFPSFAACNASAPVSHPAGAGRSPHPVGARRGGRRRHRGQHQQRRWRGN